MDNRQFRIIIVALLALAGILFILLTPWLQATVVVSLFILANMVISNYKKIIRLPVEIEVLTLGVVLCAINYGLKAALVVAILGGILSFFVGLDVSPFVFPMFLGYIVMAFVAYGLRTLDITIVGMITTLANNAIVFMIYHFVFRYDIFKNIRFSLSNIAINVILFFNIAPFLNSLL